MLRAYKYRLHPTKEQKTFFAKSFGCVRYIYNWALAKRVEAYQTESKRINSIELCKMLTEFKKQEGMEWLKEVSNECLQQSIRNHHLARSIGSVGWSTFFSMLEYKCEWYGKTLIRIGRFEPSSKMCGCGYINRELKLSDRSWTCPKCGITNDRDLLAAQNIKRFGLQAQNLLTQPVAHRGLGGEAPLTDERSESYLRSNGSVKRQIIRC